MIIDFSKCPKTCGNVSNLSWAGLSLTNMVHFLASFAVLSDSCGVVCFCNKCCQLNRIKTTTTPDEADVMLKRHKYHFSKQVKSQCSNSPHCLLDEQEVQEDQVGSF